ncbi:MAG: HIT domain-containing protein [Sulfurospirillum sp.]|nr:HIT domain-containing protein [Sulfurospirillum sp.]
MEHLYAPWRDAYIKNKIEGCPFCYIVENPDIDAKTKVLFRSTNCFIVMNLYPYTPGHLMVIPNRHLDKLEDLEESVWQEMNVLVFRCVTLLKKELHVSGVNLGMNLGSAAGAGIAEHIHYHIVPRWQRDTNFITTIAHTRVYSTDFESFYQKIKQHIPKYFG